MQRQGRNCLQIIVKNNGWNVVNSYYTVCGLSTLFYILKFYAYSNEVVLFLCQFSRKENRSLERWRNQPEVAHKIVHLCFDLITGSSVPEPVLLITLLHCLTGSNPLPCWNNSFWVTYKKLCTCDIDTAFWWPEKQPKCYLSDQDTLLCFTNTLPILYGFQWSETLVLLEQMPTGYFIG